MEGGEEERTRRVLWKDSSRLRIESGRARNIWGEEGKKPPLGDIDGKDFKDSFCVTHPHTCALYYGSFMKDKMKSGNVFITEEQSPPETPSTGDSILWHRIPCTAVYTH